MALLEFRPVGIYCPPADVYIDPTRKVSRAVITHGHSDHARRGMDAYLCTDLAEPTLRHRLGPKVRTQSLTYGQTIDLNGVKLSFHPAGHILGSAQVRLEYRGEVAVITGDYKLDDDGLSTPFEPLACQHFVTETTFALPLYHWPPQTEVYAAINDWWRRNQEMGKVSILMGYSLGKSQRILKHLVADIGPIFCHPSIEAVNEIVRQQGFELPPSRPLEPQLQREDFHGAMIIAPPGALRGEWLDRIEPFTTGACSGWSLTRQPKFAPKADRHFVLSDHADWAGLNRAVQLTGAEHIYVTHGFTEVFHRWLEGRGHQVSSVA
ncbi:MAG: ligase-associated DNA damage response exonuclease [Bacteroidota bacterium]